MMNIGDLRTRKEYSNYFDEEVVIDEIWDGVEWINKYKYGGEWHEERKKYRESLTKRLDDRNTFFEEDRPEKKNISNLYEAVSRHVGSTKETYEITRAIHELIECMIQGSDNAGRLEGLKYDKND